LRRDEEESRNEFDVEVDEKELEKEYTRVSEKLEEYNKNLDISKYLN
jgi:hypothetical protein